MFMVVSRVTVSGRRNKRCSENNNTLHIEYFFLKNRAFTR
jgi:hypothetical protein